MSFLRSDRSAKTNMARVSDLYRERVRSIKTVLIFIVSVSLLFGRGPNRVMETACFDANVQ